MIVVRPSAVGMLLLMGWMVGVSAVHAAEAAREKSALLRTDQIDDQRLSLYRAQGYNRVVLMLSSPWTPEMRASAQTVRAAGWALDYWVEIARDAALAEAHPEWMASIQTHREWRRFYPEFPQEQKNEVVKVYPWVPVLYRDSFSAHLAKVDSLLKRLPAGKRIYLNDLQGAPSACGCGHPLCRWTTDYGPKVTAARLSDDAAAKFVGEVRKMVPESEVVPVWATECEAHDREGMCGGVGCYGGACWREWTLQLDFLKKTSEKIGVLATYRALQRDLPVYHPPTGWGKFALECFQTMPARYERTGVPASRLLAVIQGWDVSEAELKAQITHAEGAGALGVVVAFASIDQSWEPRLYRLD